MVSRYQKKSKTKASRSRYSRKPRKSTFKKTKFSRFVRRTTKRSYKFRGKRQGVPPKSEYFSMGEFSRQHFEINDYLWMELYDISAKVKALHDSQIRTFESANENKAAMPRIQSVSQSRS